LEQTIAHIQTNHNNDAVPHHELRTSFLDKICEAYNVVADKDGGALVDDLLCVYLSVNERSEISKVHQEGLSCKNEEYDLYGDHLIHVEKTEGEKELSQYEEVVIHHSSSTPSFQSFVKAFPLFVILPLQTCQIIFETLGCVGIILSIYEFKLLL